MGYEPTINVNDPTVSTGEEVAVGDQPDLQPGAYVGRYIVIGVLGRGGMGVVYAAHDPTLDRKVAVKLLRSTNATATERLIREAQALAKLADPHVVTIYDAGQHDEQVFIAMQLVEGENLATALTRKPAREQVLGWFLAAGRGLAAAHAAGLVHRDFKPSNVLIDRRGQVAVTDFGLARSVIPDAEPRLTAIGSIPGTPAYMSPEQHGQQSATQASDQFSFCVSLWEALFDQHPYIDGPRDSMSPYAIGYAIYDGPLIAPPRVTDVPRQVIDVLTRGLAREPDLRWSSMSALLDALAPQPERGRAWPRVLGGIALAGGAAAGAWLIASQLLATPQDTERTCATQAGERIGAVWSETRAKQLVDRFARTTKPSAAAAAANAVAALDRYASRWSTLHADACTSDRRAPDGELAVRRGACFDARLAALATVANVLTDDDRIELVDRAHAVIAGLPELADCTDGPSLLAGGQRPPAALAAQVAPLELELVAATARGTGGDYERAKTELTSIAKRADDAGWPPLAARAHLALGLQQLRMMEPARAELVRAAELATANRLDREAARAWTGALHAAGFERQPDAVAVLAPIARSAAARVGDIALGVRAEIAYGRALVRLRDWKRGAEVCRAALETARTKIDGHDEVDVARDCLVEALVPLGAVGEIEPLLATMIAERSRRLGPEHPTISDYVEIQIGIDLRRGKLADARAKAQRVLDIRRRAYPAGHTKIAEAVHRLGDIAVAEAKPDDAKRLFEEALTMAIAAKPEPALLVTNLRQALGFLAQKAGDHKKAREYFEDAIAHTRRRVGPDSIDLAIVLLNYGQIRADDNVEVGLGLIGEAQAILERANDKRVHVATAMLGMLELKARRYNAARELLEEALAHARPDDDPPNLGQMKFALAQSLVELRRDRKRARELALDAKQDLAKGGPRFAANVKAVDAWLAKYPLVEPARPEPPAPSPSVSAPLEVP